MRALQKKCQISQNDILHMKFSESHINAFIILAKFDIYFLWLP